MRKFAEICLWSVLVWGINALWLVRDSKPPAWDMALHQSYALNYLPGTMGALFQPLPWERSGNYPPFVHLAIAFFFFLFHASPHVAVLANVPATLILFWAVYELASDLAGPAATRWACLLTALTPYLIWMSRETILDYWLAAWVCASVAVLRRTRGFNSHGLSLLLGLLLGLGLLTKWLFVGFLALPIIYTAVHLQVWRSARRSVHLADSILLAGVLAGTWYLPNLPKLVRYFSENARIGAREGEPAVWTLQSWIYYLRLLEGYQFFALLFMVFLVAGFFSYKNNLLRDGKFLVVAIVGGWLAMTLLRTKDPRFTMPLLPLLVLIPAAWIASWPTDSRYRASKAILMAVLAFQAYAANFGVSWLPKQIVLAEGYRGSLPWSWNLYLQDYFGILGPPSRDSWQQGAILHKVAEHARGKNSPVALALVPDLPRFNSANFSLQARMMGLSVRVEHLQSADAGLRSFDGYQYVLMSERDQGMSWSTTAASALNRIIVDEPSIFQLVELYALPNGDCARLYFIHRNEKVTG
jgi:4-amino-4-deoxy-L-arabinose transferase-like glycosyltransferase